MNKLKTGEYKTFERGIPFTASTNPSKSPKTCSTIENERGNVTNNMRHTNNREREFISLVEQLIHENPIPNGDIQVQKGSMGALMLQLQIQLFRVYGFVSFFEIIVIIDGTKVVYESTSVFVKKVK